MNSVDRFDQVHSTSPMMRKERRVSMTLFNFIIDVSIQNAFALYQTLGKDGINNVRDFKRRIAEELISPYIKLVMERTTLSRVTSND